MFQALHLAQAIEYGLCYQIWLEINGSGSFLKSGAPYCRIPRETTGKDVPDRRNKNIKHATNDVFCQFLQKKDMVLDDAKKIARIEGIVLLELDTDMQKRIY